MVVGKENENNFFLALLIIIGMGICMGFFYECYETLKRIKGKIQSQEICTND